MAASSYVPIDILLVEDNPAHANLTRKTLQESRIANTLSIVTDGEMAMDFLHQTGNFSNSSRPDLVLLDLGLPKKTGLEVLEEMKADPDLKSIPVIILTTSSSERDVLTSYNLQASTFITKPIHVEEFIEVIKTIANYWLVIAKLPRE